MKKTQENIDSTNDELLDEYIIDYTKVKRNPYAKILRNQERLISIEPDVYKVFKTSEQVNNALRALINAIPKKKRKSHEKV